MSFFAPPQSPVKSIPASPSGALACATLALILPAAMSAFSLADAAPAPLAATLRPFLADYCVSCHGAEKQKGDIRLDGLKLTGDLFKRAPERVLAWSDGFPKPVVEAAAMTAKVPFAYAWEFTPAEEKERHTLREAKFDLRKSQPTPPLNLSCRANTYGFPHGVYSKFNFFAFYLDRCIAQRLPKELPEPGKPVILKPWVTADGWAGDYNEIGNWNAIAPAKDAKGMVDPQWLPDEYSAWAWRAYHTHRPEIRLTAPIVEYRKSGDRKDCGFGFGPAMKPGTPLAFAAEGTGEFAQVEFRDGDRLLFVFFTRNISQGNFSLHEAKASDQLRPVQHH